jgi:hypothetical protein
MPMTDPGSDLRPARGERVRFTVSGAEQAQHLLDLAG